MISINKKRERKKKKKEEDQLINIRRRDPRYD